MGYTYEQISTVLEQAMADSLIKTNNTNAVADYMDKAFNNGIRVLFNDALYRFAKMEHERMVKA